MSRRKFSTRDKLILKMSRDGIVERNLTTGGEKRLSKRDKLYRLRRALAVEPDAAALSQVGNTQRDKAKVRKKAAYRFINSEQKPKTEEIVSDVHRLEEMPLVELPSTPPATTSAKETLAYIKRVKLRKQQRLMGKARIQEKVRQQKSHTVVEPQKPVAQKFKLKKPTLFETVATATSVEVVTIFTAEKFAHEAYPEKESRVERIIIEESRSTPESHTRKKSPILRHSREPTKHFEPTNKGSPLKTPQTTKASHEL